MFFKQTELSLGTGFFYERHARHYLITNWHNVSGRDPRTFKLLSAHGGLPDRMTATISKSGVVGEWMVPGHLLYLDAEATEQPTHPIWYVHPQLHQQVDVIAIPLDAPPGGQIYPINTMNSVPDMRLTVSGNVFVLGYPKGISGGGAFPIWKRASIATEPELELDGLPMMLVDTATRKGMSGAPVIAVATAGYTKEDGSTHIGAQGTRFVGRYWRPHIVKKGPPDGWPSLQQGQAALLLGARPPGFTANNRRPGFELNQLPMSATRRNDGRLAGLTSQASALCFSWPNLGVLGPEDFCYSLPALHFSISKVVERKRPPALVA